MSVEPFAIWKIMRKIAFEENNAGRAQISQKFTILRMKRCGRTQADHEMLADTFQVTHAAPRRRKSNAKTIVVKVRRQTLDMYTSLESADCCLRHNGHFIAGEIAEIDGFRLDPALGAASIRIAVSQLRGDS
jgi:hypothetical protein